MTATELIALLDLKPLPLEGGYFRETYRCADRVTASALPPRYGRDKALGTAIFYLLTPDTFSAMHRLPTDEVFHFYLGDPVEMLLLEPDHPGRVATLGSDLAAGQRPQIVVPAGVWQGSLLAPGGRVALLGTTMAPGFDPLDFELGDPETLARGWPEFREAIRTRAPKP